IEFFNTEEDSHNYEKNRSNNRESGETESCGEEPRIDSDTENDDLILDLNNKIEEDVIFNLRVKIDAENDAIILDLLNKIDEVYSFDWTDSFPIINSIIDIIRKHQLNVRNNKRIMMRIKDILDDLNI